ncbi:MAG: carboxypeptidase regulatory-like domain-containing protein [Deltaproteobacteria bacterium]|nr:carboxypeptidase regulatory-like domain-containing protein [Deltaproteobacteria bacterium]
MKSDMRFRARAWLVVVAAAAACGGSQPQSGTVTGTVLDRSGGAVAGASVMVPGHAVVVTNDAGAFSIPQVTVPYDLVVAGPANIEIAHGVTHLDVSVTETWNDGPTPQLPPDVDDLRVTFTGSGAGQDSEAASFVGADGGILNTTVAGPSPFTMDINANGSVSGNLYVLGRAYDSDAGANVFDFGEADGVSASPDPSQSSPTLVTVNQTRLPTAVLDIQPAIPWPDAGRLTVGASALAVNGVNFGVGLTELVFFAPAASFDVPALPDGEVQLVVALETPLCSSTWTGWAPTTSGPVSAGVLIPSAITAPVNGSTVELDGGLRLTWVGSSVADAGYMIMLAPDDPPVIENQPYPPTLWVSSMSGDVTVPDLGPLDAGLRRGLTYDAVVFTLPGISVAEQAFAGDRPWQSSSGPIPLGASCGAQFHTAP